MTTAVAERRPVQSDVSIEERLALVSKMLEQAAYELRQALDDIQQPPNPPGAEG